SRLRLSARGRRAFRGESMSNAAQTKSIEERADKLFDARKLELTARVDRLFGWLMVGQWIFGILIAVVFSPYGWSSYGGVAKQQHLGWQGFDVNSFNLNVAIFFGGLISSLPFALARLRPGWIATRYVIACAQMM